MSSNETLEKNSAVWTEDSVVTLLRLYESKLGMLTTPKKKTRIWIAISDALKDYNIETNQHQAIDGKLSQCHRHSEHSTIINVYCIAGQKEKQMSSDQVRWKINALTKRYKQSIDSGQQSRFKYFKELNNIYAQYNISCYTISQLMERKNNGQDLSPLAEYGMQQESKVIIELRKNRLANKIESDRRQSKVQLEKQWLEYLTSQEEQLLFKDEICERNLKLRQEVLELRKRELEMRESLELRRLYLKEKEQEEIIKLEKQKCDMLKNIFT